MQLKLLDSNGKKTAVVLGIIMTSVTYNCEFGKV